MKYESILKLSGMKEDVRQSACYLLLNGENMLTNFLMTLSGGLDFCLANVLLECCISVFSYSCPASHQRPVCVCVQGRQSAVCVVSVLVSYLLDVSWILLRVLL